MSLIYEVGPESKRFSFEIKAVRVGELKPHEQVISEAVSQLVRDMQVNRVQRDPVVVDRKTLTVLDGMHRVSAARMLNIDYLVAMLVDYYSDKIELETWWRVFRVSPAKFIDEIRRLVGSGQAGGDEFKASWGSNTVEMTLSTRDLEAHLEFNSLVDKLSDVFGEPAITSSPASNRNGYVSIQPPRITKDLVVKTASTGALFPAKTTRHVFPTRVMSCLVPIKLLGGGLRGGRTRGPSQEMIPEAVEAYLRPRSLLAVDGKEYIGERYYAEQQLLFYI
ncbi:MAG: hypothetical protein M1357_00990 [Candidatus Marsarchaeota archaeon]|nr:hypothetical protein [Candidatus Marsarchaeota archaeon]